jgi:hypothetical protein
MWNKITKTIENNLEGITGQKKAVQAKTEADGRGSLPWKTGFLESNKDVFFPSTNIEPSRSQELFPYRLIVIDSTTNKPVAGSAGSVERIYDESNTGGVQYRIGKPEGWVFTLPITPQQLSITDQFAINTTATMRGVVEEHNGVKFKMISASGTTGIWPNRPSGDDDNTPGLSLFGGSFSAFEGAKNAWKNILNQKTIPTTSTRFNNGRFQTGYYQALVLQQFLEQYAIAKKNPENRNWRLVFDCPKTNESFIVTPIQYTVTRSQRSPGEFLYSMQFKAWKRIDLKSTPKSVGKSPQKITPNFFQKAVSALDNARSAMSASLNVVKAVRADFRQIFDQVRKVTLLYKDLGGLAFAAADLPNQIGKDLKSSVKAMSGDLAQGSASFDAAFKKLPSASKSAANKTKNIVKSIKQNKEVNEGVSDEQVSAGLLGKEAKDANDASSLNNVFDEPEASFDFFNAISLDTLTLTPQQSIAIQEEIEKNSLISIEEIKEVSKNLQSLALDISNNFGAGDENFSKIFNRPAPKERAVPMTLEEFELILALENAILELNLSTATRELDDSRRQNPLEYVGGLADDSGIPFNSESTAKFLAPVPFGLTIEQISARYLGDPDRYNEIITLNGLRSPYIDENGFSYQFLSNGDGRQFNISSKENLFIGQKVQLSSSEVPMFTRKITGIEKISDTNYLITVDGIDDLHLLKTVDAAKVKAFLPGTINSQNQIYIPSDQSVTEEARTYDIPFLKEDTLTGFSKVDWLMDENGDLVVNSFGEMALANGTTNLIQALKMKIMTQKGTLLSDPDFGLGLVPGVSVSEVDIENVLTDLRDMVLQDPRFSDIENIELNILPPTVSISINAVLANGKGIFPINFSL